MVNKILEKRREQMFPKLTAAQMARLEAHGRRVETRAGEVLLELGARPRNIFIVLAGSLEILLHATIGGESVYLLTSGDFSGEMSTLKGSVSLARIRVREGGAVAALDTDKLREIVQTDAELSELLMRAFILRRVALISDENPDVMLLDEPSNHLDIETTAWLENYLSRQSVAMVVVSHDRYFLDKVVTRIWELNEGKIEPYPGNYTQYWRLRTEPSTKTWRPLARY